MNKVTRIKSKNFTTISNVFLRDKNLSLKAKGLLATVLTLPDDWDFSINGICAIVKEGKTAVYSAIDELKENGYCKVDISRNEKGHITGNDYVFVEEPHSENLNMDNQTQINTEIIKEKKEKTVDKKKELFEECWIAYRRKGSKKLAYEQWCKLSDLDKERVAIHIKAYTKAREREYQKDFERYLKGNTFLDVVFQGNNIIYDPNFDDSSAVYTPVCEASLMYNEQQKCYMYIGYWDGRHIPDGYDDDNRPDGASVTLNNGRGVLVWDKETKQWRNV